MIPSKGGFNHIKRRADPFFPHSLAGAIRNSVAAVAMETAWDAPK